MGRSDELLDALLRVGQPPGWDGEQGRYGIAGISAFPRGRTWDAVVSAHAPDLTGESVTFVALVDGVLVLDQDIPDDSLAPVAERIEELVQPPYRAAAAKTDKDVWTAVAESVAIAELPGVEGDSIDLTRVDGVRELRIDGETTMQPLPGLDHLLEEHGDVAIHAERVDRELFAVDVFPL
jgi:hypothetical protein